jgi:hypothetical protein
VQQQQDGGGFRTGFAVKDIGIADSNSVVVHLWGAG